MKFDGNNRIGVCKKWEGLEKHYKEKTHFYDY